MKKIGKLSINPEKIIKNEELVNLKGGDELFCENCMCFDNTSPDVYNLGYVGPTWNDCHQACQALDGDWVGSCQPI